MMMTETTRGPSRPVPRTLARLPRPRLPRLRAAMILIFGVMPGGIGIDGALDRIERMP